MQRTVCQLPDPHQLAQHGKQHRATRLAGRQQQRPDRGGSHRLQVPPAFVGQRHTQLSHLGGAIGLQPHWLKAAGPQQRQRQFTADRVDGQSIR